MAIILNIFIVTQSNDRCDSSKWCFWSWWHMVIQVGGSWCWFIGSGSIFIVLKHGGWKWQTRMIDNLTLADNQQHYASIRLVIIDNLQVMLVNTDPLWSVSGEFINLFLGGQKLLLLMGSWTSYLLLYRLFIQPFARGHYDHQTMGMIVMEVSGIILVLHE